MDRDREGSSVLVPGIVVSSVWSGKRVPMGHPDTKGSSMITTRQKVGLALAGVLSFLNLFSAVGPAPEGAGGTAGPPQAVLIAGSILGLVGLVAVVVAWRTAKPAALRIAAGAITVAALTAVPAFFVPVPAPIKVVVGLTVLATIAAIVLMFSTSRQSESQPQPA